MLKRRKTWSSSEVNDGKLDDFIPQQRAISEGKIDFHALTNSRYPGIMIPSGQLSGLHSIGFWDAVGVPDWGMNFHRNEGLEIVFLETGKMDFAVEQSVFPLSAGNLTVTRPWQPHCHGIPFIGPGRLHWMILDIHSLMPDKAWKWPSWVALLPQDLKDLTDSLRTDNRCVWRASSDIQFAFKKISEVLSDPVPTRYLSSILIYINLILVGLLQTIRLAENASRQGESPGLIATAQFFKQLSTNPSLTAKVWTLETMAKKVGVGPTALTRYCHLITNTTPMDYLNVCRLSWAAQRLKESADDPIIAIALQAGFSSSAYFATRFRQRYGCSPSEYRMRIF